MNGLYYETIQRNLHTGKTQFWFQPAEPCDYTQNGLVKCEGNIGIYAYKMPLSLTGTYKDGVFYVEQEDIASKNTLCAEQMLKNVYPFTEAQINRIIKHAGTNLVYFVNTETAEPFLFSVLTTEKDETHRSRCVKQIIRRIKSLGQKEMFFKYLIQYGVPLDRIEVLFKRNVTLTDLRLNPYLPLIFADIDVYTADNIAMNLRQVTAYDMQRMIGFIYESVKSSRIKGNTCIEIHTLKNIINGKLSKSLYPNDRITIPMMMYYFSFMKKNITLYHEDNTIYVYETHIFEEESAVIYHLSRLCTVKSPIVDDICPERIGKQIGIIYKESQKAAFQALASSGIKVITGPPGSGKTATINGLIENYRQAFPEGKIIKLAATTGQASQVMASACGSSAQTVHKLLDIKPYENHILCKDGNNPINADLVIVDEISMMGLQTAALLLQAIKNNTILILVGDEDQLQSVEYGNFLHDILQNSLIEVYRLTDIFRQSGTICDNAQKINHGDIDITKDTTFVVNKFDNELNLWKILLSDLKKEPSIDNYKVISSIKGRTLGTANLNHLIQDSRKELHQNDFIVYGDTTYYQNDCIIMNQTNYQSGYYNGDIGIITSCADDEHIRVQFHDKLLTLGREDLYYMSLAYAITAHKSQGAEYNHVYIVLPDDPKNMLTRRILYTAATRGKKCVHIYTMNDAMEIAIQNQNEHKRCSLLNKRSEKNGNT